MTKVVATMETINASSRKIVEQAAAAAQSLKDQSDRLSDTVKVFKLAA